MLKKLYLIRHGQTPYTGKRYCGFIDASLTTEGVSEASLLKNYFKNKKIDRVYSSDLIRALKTARLIFPRKEIIATPHLRELNFGAWEGLDYKEISSSYGELYENWLNDPVSISPPQGETLIQLRERVLEFIKTDLGEDIAIVSHTGPIVVILLFFLGKSLHSFYDFRILPASVSILEFEHGILSNCAINIQIDELEKKI